MTLDDALITFIAESGELLEEMEAALLSIDAGQADPEAVNAIFRAAHTIKGSAGLFGIDHMVAFTHVAESVLDLVRKGSCPLDGELVRLLLACRDHLGVLVEAVQRDGVAENAALCAAGDPLVEQLQRYLAPQAQAADDSWQISLSFGSSVLQNGMDPMSFVRYLATLGQVAGITLGSTRVPPLAELDAEACYLDFEITLRSGAAKADIDAVFDFVRDDCAIRIGRPAALVADTIRLIEEQEPRANERLGEALVRSSAVSAAQLARALETQQQGDRLQPIGQILVAQGAIEAPVVEAALARQGKARGLDAGSIRVDADKLDHLINLVGELIITTASANMIARRAGHAQFLECSSTLSALVEDVRNSALQLRMVKIGATFKRFQRVVHDVARELNKEIVLHLSGEDTELDKAVVEKIADPLTHLVRNAMDHGIEAAELRAARGKPAAGAIALNAYHDSGTIVIEVADDGGGLQRDRIMAKALERGLVEAGRVLSDAEVFALVFEPGFSTAEAVTNLSGRGVGMDVVKRNITALRGTVAIDSVAGEGTTVTVRLPLTLAIIDGFQVGIGRSVFVIPLDMVEECIEYSAEPGHSYANLRGQVLPLVSLRAMFDLSGQAPLRQSVIVVKHGAQRAGLVVDFLLGESQTVIKPLGKLFQGLQCISGSSILGSGEVALILDVPALIGQAEQGAQAPAIGTALRQEQQGAAIQA